MTLSGFNIALQTSLEVKDKRKSSQIKTVTEFGTYPVQSATNDCGSNAADLLNGKERV